MERGCFYGITITFRRKRLFFTLFFTCSELQQKFDTVVRLIRNSFFCPLRDILKLFQRQTPKTFRQDIGGASFKFLNGLERPFGWGKVFRARVFSQPKKNFDDLCQAKWVQMLKNFDFYALLISQILSYEKTLIFVSEILASFFLVWGVSKNE